MQDESKKIAKGSKSSFYYAFTLLPSAKREAMNTVYAFCRRTDDIVDEGELDVMARAENLRKWRVGFELALKGKSENQLLNKLAAIINKFNIPIDPFFDLIKGVEMDLTLNRYMSYDELLKYCYRVASTVGLMCIEVFGYKNKSAREYAVKLGLAMQLTNILRDVKKDAEIGRIYLPKEDLDKFNYTEEELFNCVYNENFEALMNYEADKAKHLFEEANRALQFEDKPSMFAARAMQHIYYKLLKKLEANRFNVFSRRININKFEKAAISIGVWAKYNLVY